jgi:uncharacterized pyridoxamine 5'-phosphate oxidase family protein
MDIQDCVKFATENPICYLATIDGDQARVRALMMWYADEGGFYFITLSPKEMSDQLHANPKTEICFYNGATEFGDMKQMRVTGPVTFLTGEDWLARAYEARAALEPVVGPSLPEVVEPFVVSTGEAHFWTIMDAMKERDLPRIAF